MVSRITDILISIIAAAISVLIYGNLNQINIIGANFPTVLLILGTAIFLRIVSNLFYLPAKLYFDAIKKQDRFAWEYIIVSKRELKSNKEFQGYGVHIKNEKPFPFDLFIQIPYFEIDGAPNTESELNLNREKCRRLSWVENPNLYHTWRAWIGKDKGRATFYLFHKISGPNKNYVIRYNEYSGDGDNYVEKTIPVKNYVNGRLNVLIIDLDGYGKTAHEYNFEIRINGNKKPTMKISDGGIIPYKSPRSEEISTTF